MSSREWLLFCAAENQATWSRGRLTVRSSFDSAFLRRCSSTLTREDTAPVITSIFIHQSNPDPDPNPNITTKQHAIVSIHLNIVACSTYPEKFIQDDPVAFDCNCHTAVWNSLPSPLRSQDLSYYREFCWKQVDSTRLRALKNSTTNYVVKYLLSYPLHCTHKRRRTSSERGLWPKLSSAADSELEKSVGHSVLHATRQHIVSYPPKSDTAHGKTWSSGGGGELPLEGWSNPTTDEVIRSTAQRRHRQLTGPCASERS